MTKLKTSRRPADDEEDSKSPIYLNQKIGGSQPRNAVGNKWQTRRDRYMKTRAIHSTSPPSRK